MAMVSVKQQHSDVMIPTAVLAPPSASSRIVPAQAIASPPSSVSKRPRLSQQPARALLPSASFSSPPLSASSSSSAFPFESPALSQQYGVEAIAAGLAPSSIHRQHSSGTGQVLEASLFDAPSMAYSISPQDMAASSPSSSLFPFDDDSRKQAFRTPSFSFTTQPGFDSLAPSMSSASSPHFLGLPSLLHGQAEGFSPSPFAEGDYGTAVLPQQRGSSYMLGLQSSPEQGPSASNGESQLSSFDFSSPSHAQQQQIAIGSLQRFSSDDQLREGAPAAGGSLTAEQVKRESSMLDFSTPSSTSSSLSSASRGSYPHVVPPSHSASSLPSSPSSSPPASPKHKQQQPASSSLSVSRKRHRRSEEDGDKDEKSSVSSSASTHSSGAKDRHVNTAVKLLTANEESGEFVMETKVRQVFYPRPDWPKPHRIRLIEVEEIATGHRSVYAHGADVGSVVERKSNISRLFGKFSSPDEKLLMNVPGPHNHTVGQESNILTELGIRRFLDTNKMKGQDHYRQWIITELIPRLSTTSDANADDNRRGDRQLQQQQQQQAAMQQQQQQQQQHLHQPQQLAGRNHHLLAGNVYGATDSPQSLPSSPQSYSSYSSDSHYSH